MTTFAHALEAQRAPARPSPVREIRIALLGLGHVGGAIAELTARAVEPGATTFQIASALVRDLAKPRGVDTSALHLTTDPRTALATRPDVLIEVLGGIEPARTIVLEALNAGIPVVTANKTLLAYCGTELFEAAARTGVPLLYEASVLAGVPFLGTLGRRPLARSISGLRGILNGTSNFILSRMNHDGVAFAEALASAQRAGFAEPDPSKDIGGDDAVEKLCVLLRHVGGFDVQPSQIEKVGISDIELRDQRHAAAFGGALRPIVLADWTDSEVTAYAGPAYVDGTNALCRVDGVQNAIALSTRWSGELFFSGPGAGPTVTAATVLDDVTEASVEGCPIAAASRPVAVGPPRAGAWFIRLTSSSLGEGDAPALLSSLGIRLRRVSHIDARSGCHSQWLLTHPCNRPHIDAALDVLASKNDAAAWRIPVLE